VDFLRENLQTGGECAPNWELPESAVPRVPQNLFISTGLVLIILFVELAKGNNFLQTLGICVVLLVACVPIAMQAVCVATMAVGANSLAQRKAVVTRLRAIEELAGMEVLCTDKTGSLRGMS